MREVDGDVVSSLGHSSAPQPNPNQAQIENLLILASTAFEAQNNAEAEQYCNRVIELDATCYKAWQLKGKAVGWSSTLGNNRVQEATHSFSKAIEFAPVDEKDELVDAAVEELKKFGIACISLREQNFAETPGENQLKGFRQDRKVILDSLMVLIAHGNNVGIPKGYQSEIASKMSSASNKAFVALMALEATRLMEAILTRRQVNDSDLIPQYENCYVLAKEAIDACDDDDTEDVERYKTAVMILEHITEMNDCSNYKKDEYAKKLKALKAEQAQLEKKMKAEEKKKEMAEKEEKRKRIEAYWEAHADEKKALESEKHELTSKLNAAEVEMRAAKKEIDSINSSASRSTPSEPELAEVNKKISALKAEKDSLGLFSGKRKKEIDAEVAALDGRISSLKSKAQEERYAQESEIRSKVKPFEEKVAAAKKEIDAAKKRIKAIDAELAKDPAK